MVFKLLPWLCVSFAAIFFYSVATGEDVSSTLLSDPSFQGGIGAF